MTMQRISSPQNQRVKDAIKLRQHRGRKKRQRIIIDGAREVARAMQAGVEVVELFVCPELLEEHASRPVLALAARKRAETLEVTRDVFRKLAFGARAEGLVAIARTPTSAWPEWQLPPNPLVVVLQRVEKPGNVGGVLRTADAVGASAVLVADPAADIFNPNTIRASLGAVFTVPVAAASSEAILRWLRGCGLRILAARVGGAANYSEVDLAAPCALVLGSEALGLSPQWDAADITAISLPLRGKVDSLNVSVTAAVLMYEALRQRQFSA
jgi:TrmH family RNA methyltransferase